MVFGGLDDVVSRGSLADWIELLCVLQSQPTTGEKLWQVIQNYPDPSAQSYHFFQRVIEGEPLQKPGLLWDWLRIISHLDMTNFTWEDLLAVASRLQTVFPNAVLVGGTATALYAEHRISFDAILADLESVAGWRIARWK